jgi:hypothetical protein
MRARIRLGRGANARALLVSLALGTAGAMGVTPLPTIAAAGVQQQTQTVSDGFEAQTQNPFWTLTQGFGSVTLSAAQAHAGKQSVQFSSTSGGQRDMHMVHAFAAPTKGDVSVWFYDAAPGQETLYEKLNLYNSSQPNLVASIGTQDFDANCYSAVFDDPTGTAHGQNANCGAYPQTSTTNVHRTVGWHRLDVQDISQYISFSIDGQWLFTVPGDFVFDTIELSVTGPYWRPNTSAYFDDFRFLPEIWDAFDIPVMNPFWRTSQAFGTVGLSTLQAHGGRQSAQFSSSSGGQREMHLTHVFPAATKGDFSVWFYDAAPGQETLYEKLNLSNSAQPNLIASIGAQDFDANCYSAVFDDPSGTAHGQNANCGAFPQTSTTSVRRTLGWHNLEVKSLAESVSVAIDGQWLFSVPGSFAFDTIDLSVSGPYWRPNTTTYFDDFVFVPSQ